MNTEPAANEATAGDAKPRRLLRLADVISRCGLGKTAIYERIKKGAFPKPVDLGGVVAWVESEIDAWIAELIAERDKAA